MIGYVCKYAPIDILESFGEKMYRINNVSASFKHAECMLHNNMCSYSKAVIEECYDKNINKIILVNCCDSIRRLYDNLKSNQKFEFVYMIDLPRKINHLSIKLFTEQILNFINEYEKYCGRKFSVDNFIKVLTNKRINSQIVDNNVKNISVIGARCENYIIDTLKKYGCNVLNFTCSGIDVDYNKIDISSTNAVINNYCFQLLNQFPCMRMCSIDDRYTQIKKRIKNTAGIIYHTIKFCDYYPFDYVKLKNILDIPVIRIETDFTLQSEGQIRTRLDAFIESFSKTYRNSENTTDTTLNKIAAGIDSGSTSTNVVIMDSNKNILSSSVVDTGAKSLEGAKRALKDALKKADLKFEKINYIISTGYGRVSIPFANEEVTEITCHGKGAFFLNKDIRTIIDIGGQDSKVISLDAKGNVKDFSMNDKCAAGTGRFLANMAKILEIDINDMGKEALKSKKDITITSTCTVFAESEVVSLIAQNNDKCDIINGLCKSISNRTAALVNRVGKNKDIMMTGGVAKNIGVVHALEQTLNEKIIVPPQPQIVGAIGACLIAIDKISR